MKKLLYLILLLPILANAQVNISAQKTKATNTVRVYNLSLGADTLVTLKGSPVNGQLLQYSSSDTAWVPYTIPIDGSTGIISGGTITGVGTANAIVASGSGAILDNTSPSSPALYELSWSTDTIGLTDNTTNYLYYDSLGVLNVTTTIPNPANFRTRVYLGRAQKASGVITSINGAYVPVQQTPATIKDMFTAYGLTKTGLVVSPASTNLTIAVASGGIFSFGANFQSSVLNPNNLSYTANSPQTFRMVTAGDISSTDITVLPVGSYNPTGTTVSAIGGGANESSIFTVYKFPTTGNVRVLYGQTLYSSLANAVQAIGSYVPNPPAVFSDAIIIGYIAAVKNATNLSNTAQAVFVTTNKFGGVGGGFASTALTNYMQTDFSNKTAAVPISFGTFGSTPNANGGSYSADVITLQPADATNPGGLSTGTQTIAGAKSLTDALSLIGTNSTLNFNRSVNTQSATQYFITNSIAKWRVGLTPTTDDNYHIKNETTATDALSIDNSTNVMTLSSLSAGGLVKSTLGALGIASTSDLNTAGIVLTTTNQSIANTKTFTGAIVNNGGIFGEASISSSSSSSVGWGLESTSGDATFIITRGTITNNPYIGFQSVGQKKWEIGLRPSSNNLTIVNPSVSGQPIVFSLSTATNALSLRDIPVGTGGTDSVLVHDNTTDEIRRVSTTGTGSAVFSASPTFTGTVVAADMTTGDITTNANNKGMYFNGTRNAILGNNSTDEVTIVTANGTGQFLHGATGDFTISGANATKASGTAWINPSDLRLKTNVGEYSKGLAEVLKIKPKTWYFNEASGFDTTKLHLSPIAQELREVMPEMVSTYKGKLNGKAHELLQVDASDMTWLLVKAIQDQQEIIEKLNERITVLENK